MIHRQHAIPEKWRTLVRMAGVRASALANGGNTSKPAVAQRFILDSTYRELSAGATGGDIGREGFDVGLGAGVLAYQQMAHGGNADHALFGVDDG